jgi:hypothetical protein
MQQEAEFIYFITHKELISYIKLKGIASTFFKIGAPNNKSDISLKAP